MQEPVAERAWRPRDEAEATGNRAAFLLFLAACRGVALDGPAALAGWAAAEPAAFEAAIRAFAGIGEAAGYVAALAGGGGRLVLLEDGARREWAAADLAHAALPARLARLLAAGTPTMLAGQAADHLLRLDLRPDQAVLWAGGLEDPWPLGALLAGATLVLCDPAPREPEAVAAAQGAALLRRPG